MILVLNTGSSSIKFALYTPQKESLLRGQIKSFPASPTLKIAGELGTKAVSVQTVSDALEFIFQLSKNVSSVATITAVGHRVVHGGDSFDQATHLTDEVKDQLAALSPLAPSHQPAALEGITATERLFPQAAQIACFDTSFHRTVPEFRQLYALPRDIVEGGVKRYGFHGLSYAYTAQVMAERLAHLDRPRIIAAHLGSGASLCAIHGTQSVATTMGLTALDGLPMATRCGDLDPGAVLHLIKTGRHVEDVEALLYKDSGLKGLSGLSADMPTLLDHLDQPAVSEAIDYYCDRVRMGIAQMAAALGGIDALVFSGGVGENAAPIRARIVNGLDWMGLALDDDANEAGQDVISPDGDAKSVHIIETDEEAVMADQVASVLTA